MTEARSQALSVLREATWFDAQRARAYCIILAAVSLVVSIGYLALSHDGLDPMGKPIGTDFASFWTASQLALEGHPADAWSMVRHGAVQAERFGKDAGYAAFFYPPPYLLVCLPLALMPYLLALAVWLAATGAAWGHVLRGWIGASRTPGIGLLPLLTFPAVLINVGHGQNGFLTAALLGGGALLQPRRPWLAGLLFGGLVIKPHFGLLLPFYLLFARDWRCIVATGATAVALCLATLAIFGWPVWAAFLANADNATAVLAHNTVGYHKMQSVFAAARLLAAPYTLAMLFQVAMALGVLAVLYRLRQTGSDLANAAALCTGALLATPFVLDYDLTLLAVPLVWLYAQTQRTGFLPWERLLLGSAFLFPLLSRTLATAYLPVAPLLLLAVLMAIARRAQPAAVS
jgi:alpha-1,2-mannosyltransferase